MIRWGKVVRVNPTRRTVDLVDLETNEPIREATVAGSASSVSGSWNVPDMPLPASQAQAGQLSSTGRSMVAVVARYGARATVLGFVPDYTNFVAFTDADRAVDVHPSGVVHSVDATGNIQISHPGGTTVRIGTTAVENLADVAVNGNFPLPTQAKPTITVATGALTLTVDPTGNITVSTPGNVAVSAQNATVSASATATIMGASVVLGAGGKRVVVDGDPVSTGGHVEATQTRVTAG